MRYLLSLLIVLWLASFADAGKYVTIFEVTAAKVIQQKELITLDDPADKPLLEDCPKPPLGCGGTGWKTAGDGHKYKCTYHREPEEEQGQAPPSEKEPEEKPEAVTPRKGRWRWRS